MSDRAATQIIRTDGTRLALVDNFSFRDLQEAVNGYVEFVSLADGWVLALNEDGRPLGLAPNRAATEDARSRGLPGDYALVGDVVLLSPEDYSRVMEVEEVEECPII